MAYTEDVNVNLNVLAGAMGGVTAIMGGMSALTSTFGEFGTQAASSFGTVDGILVSATALLVSFGVQASEAFGEFEQGMKIVQTVSGQSNAAINQLTNAANEMSVAYRTSIGDITEGLQTLGRAGLNSATEQLEVLESGLQTAKLEGRNLNGVLEELIQNTSMLGGDLKSVDFGDQASYVNSLMVGTSMSAPIDTHDVSQTLQYAGGTAAAAGANLQDKDKLEDLMGTVAAFAQKGVTGSMAGTALRAFFTKPASQDNSVTEGLGMIGLSPYQLWEDGGESMKDVSDQIAIIQGQMDKLNLSTMDQVEIWGKIVGPKMGQQMMKLKSDDIKELTRDIQEASSAEELATQTLQTYTQKISEMKQQGELAYREFGEKAAVVLLPIVEGITKILGLLSTPVGSFAAFGTVGAIVIRGLRAAWNMISSIYSQFKSMIADVRMGIQNINSIAGGSASGFGQSASQVDFLNAKLRETNSEMQQLQAQSLGIRPGYIMPGALPTDKVQRGTFKAYEENVIQDQAGVLGREGQYFSGENKASYEQGIDDLAQKMEDDKEAAKVDLEEKISNKKADIKKLAGMREEEFSGKLELEEEQLKEALDTKVAEATQMHNQAVENIQNLKRDVLSNTKGVKIWNRTGIPIDVQKEAFNDPNVEFASQFGVNSPEYKRAIQKYIDKSSLSHLNPADLEASFDEMINAENKSFDEEVRGLKEQYEKDVTNAKIDLRNQTVKDYSDEMNQLSSELKDLEAMDIDDSYSTMTKDEISNLKKDGIKKVRTELRLLDEAEYEAWKRRMEESGELGQYSIERTNEFYDETSKLNQYYGKELDELEKKGYRVVAESHAVPDSHPNVEVLGQALNNNIPQEMARAREDYIRKQQALFSGKEITKSTSGLNSFSSALDRAKASTSNFRDDLRKWNERRSRDSDWITKDNNIGTYQGKISNLLDDEDFVKKNIQGQETAVAMTNLRNELNLTAQEFALLISSSTELQQIMGGEAVTYKELGQEALLLREKLAQILAIEGEEAVASEEVVAAKRREVTASNAAAAADTKEAASGILGSLKSGASSLVSYMGGPFMAAMMGATAAMEAIRMIQEKWQEQMQEAQQTFSEAEDKLSSAEENISQTLRDQDNSITDAQIEQYIDYQTGAIQEAYNNSSNPSYSDMIVQEMSTVGTPELTEEQKEQQEQGYVVIPGEDEMNTMEESAKTLTIATEENQSELQKNTAALQAATYAYTQAEGLKQKQFQDPLMGWQGESSKLSDGERSLLNFIPIANALNVFNMATSFLQKRDEGFLDNNTPLLKSSQADKDYAGSTEFAGIFAADMNDAMRNKSYLGQSDDDSITAGLQQFFGNDYDQIIGLMRNMDNKVGADGYGALKAYGKVFGSMDYDTASRAQLMLKDNKSDFQKLGKQMFRYEQQYGFDQKRTAYGDFKYLRQIGGRGTLADKRAGRAGLGSVKTASGKEVSKALSKAKLTVTDKNLIKTVERLIKLSDNKLTEANVLALGSMQQLQDMYQVANEQVAPGINQTVQGVYDTVGVTSTAASNAGNASDGAFSASNNAAAIAAFLGAQAQETAYNATRQAAIDNGDATTGGFFGIGGHVMTEDEWRDTLNNNMDPKYDKYRQDTINAIRGAGLQVNHPDYTPDQIKNRTNEITKGLVDDVNSGKVKMKDAMNTATKPLLQFAQGATLAAYGQSPLGEYGSGGSSGGGGGGGGGSGGGSGSNKDNTGTKKERVDLVLCNKKEIPKLNVNLFKKPPNFTILNKNFKLRDIKINSQDKPKAIMNAVKNGIIETQKRMDPKIIQDETADYDPLESTDGKSVPSGTTKTTT